MSQLRPTFSESWYRVVDLKARLRGSTQLSRQHYRGERWYVVRDPAGNQYHRLSSAAYRFVGLLDGSRSVGEAWDLVGGQLADDAPTQPEVIQILSQLHAANLLDANITADATVLLRRHKQLRKRELQGRLMNFLFPRIPLWDPDRFLCKWMPVMRLILSKVGWLVWFAAIIGAIVTLVPHWDDLRGAASDAINPENWPFLWATFVLIKLIHELGHGFSCRRFGGEVHELGVMFLVFVPAPYVDASSAWSLPSRWQRAFVGAGGMVFELFVAAIMAFVWANTGEGLLIHQLAYNAMLIASVSTVIFNANPLLRYDGYYILSDLLEIPNLQQKANEYGLGLIKRHIFRVKSSLPLPSPSQRFWLLLYAIASGIYRIFIGLVIILVVGNKVPVLGTLMAIGGIVTWAVVPLYKILNYLLIDPELHRKRIKAGLFILATAAVAVIIIGFIPFEVHYQATGVLVPKEQRVLYSQSSGFVDQILKHDGDHVAKDEPILVCSNVQEYWHNKSLKLQSIVTEAKMAYERVANPAEYLIDKHEHDVTLAEEISESQRKLDELTVRAPIDGTLIAPELSEVQGRYFHQGEQLGITVARLDKLLVEGLLDDRDVALPYTKNPGDTIPTDAKIRIAGGVTKELSGPIESWGTSAVKEIKPRWQSLLKTAGGELDMDKENRDPNSKKFDKPQFPVMVVLDNPNQTYYAGQKAYLRFDLGKRSLAWQWMRRIKQMMQTHAAENKWM